MTKQIIREIHHEVQFGRRRELRLEPCCRWHLYEPRFLSWRSSYWNWEWDSNIALARIDRKASVLAGRTLWRMRLFKPSDIWPGELECFDYMTFSSLERADIEIARLWNTKVVKKSSKRKDYLSVLRDMVWR